MTTKYKPIWKGSVPEPGSGKERQNPRFTMRIVWFVCSLTTRIGPKYIFKSLLILLFPALWISFDQKGVNRLASSGLCPDEI